MTKMQQFFWSHLLHITNIFLKQNDKLETNIVISWKMYVKEF